MIVAIRFIGVMNAAIWFGAAIFFTFGVAPTFFTPEFKSMLGQYGSAWSGVIAQMVLERFFILNYWCGAIALAHLLAEWVYLGKAIQRLTLVIIVGAFMISLVGGLWLQPKLKKLHATRYSVTGEFSDTQKLQAAKSFSFWHGISQLLNLLVMVGVGTYLWKLNYTSEGPRFVTPGKFRS